MTSPPERPKKSAPNRLSQMLHQAFALSVETPLVRPLLVITTVGLALVCAYAYAAGWFSPTRLTPKQIIATFNQDFGTHPGFRRNHAKGVCVVGYFDGNGSASGLSHALVFGASRTPVIGRFAIPGGNPEITDASSPVRSMALQFQQPNGEQWRTGMNNVPLFAVRTPQAFYEQLVAARPDPATGKPDPARMKAFLDAHPETAGARQWGKTHPPSSSWANGTYYSINAFQLVAANGDKQFVRWAMVPELAYTPVDPTIPKAADFLSHDLEQQLQQGPLRWHLILTLAKAGDVTNDATQAWPADRMTVDAGTLTLNQTVSQDDGPCRDVNFDPLILPHGIQPSSDPLLAARSSAYSRSFNVRTREEAEGAVTQTNNPQLIAKKGNP